MRKNKIIGALMALAIGMTSVGALAIDRTSEMTQILGGGVKMT